MHLALPEKCIHAHALLSQATAERLVLFTFGLLTAAVEYLGQAYQCSRFGQVRIKRQRPFQFSNALKLHLLCSL